VKIGTSRVGYLNHRSRNSILTPPSASWSSEVALSLGFAGTRKLKIRFAACAACAKSATKRWRLADDNYSVAGIQCSKGVDVLGPKLKNAPALSEPLITAM
jgi:hypothetical protein